MNVRILSLTLSVFFLLLTSFSFGDKDLNQFIFRVGGLLLAYLSALIFYFMSLKVFHGLSSYNSKIYGVVILSNLTKPVLRRVAILYIGFALISAFSAVRDPFSIYSLWKSFEVFSVIIIAYLLISKITYEQDFVLTTRMFFRSLQIILALSVALTVLHGNANFAKLAGHFPLINPNSVGALSALCLIYNVWNKSYYLSILWASVLLMSGSRTALIIVIICVIFNYVILPSRSRISTGVKRVGTVIFFLVISLVYWENMLNFWELNRQLSGRLLIWEGYVYHYLTDISILEFLMGIGIGLARNFYEFVEGLRGPVNLHNAWLEVFVSSGVISVIIFLFMFYKNLNITYKLANSEGNMGNFFRLCFFVVLALLIRSFSSSTFSSITPEFVLLVFVSFFVAGLSRVRTKINTALTSSDKVDRNESENPSMRLPGLDAPQRNPL